VCGIFDGVGYLGGILAGHTVANLVADRGWSLTFGVLATVTSASCIAAAVFWFLQARIQAPLSLEEGVQA
jgi:sugar phosphate permease